MNKIFFIVSCLLLVLHSNQAFSQKSYNMSKERVVSLELRDRPLKLVAEEILKQTGCKVVFDEKWSELPLSGQYLGVPLEGFFLRALHGKNVTSFYDDKNNIVILRFFGDRDSEKIKVSEGVKKIQGQKGQELQAYLDDPDTIAPLSGMKLVDLQKLKETQQAELQAYLEDPESISPLSGMKLVDIQKLKEIQQAELQVYLEGPESISPLSGMKLVDIQKLHNTQQEELELLKANPVAISALSGLTKGEIQVLREEGQRAVLERLHTTK